MTNDRKKALDVFPEYGEGFLDDWFKRYRKPIKAALSQPTSQELCDKIVELLDGEKKNVGQARSASQAERFMCVNDGLDKAIEIVKEVCGE